MPNRLTTTAIFKPRRSMPRLAQLLFFLLNGSNMTFVIAATFQPIITNYALGAYSPDAGVQNWDVVQGLNGEIFIGNNRGLFVFDGYNWRNTAIPSNMVIRSLMVDGERIYIGSYEEFGYFTTSDIGSYVYHSLSKSVNKHFSNGEVWSITKYNNKVYFQTFNSLFVYDGRSITLLHDTKVRPLYLHKIHNHLYVQDIYGGYYRFDGKRYSLLYDKSEFENDNIVAAISLKNNAILCSEKQGLFLMDKNFRLRKFNTEIDTELRSFNINRAIITKDSTVIIGTIQNGIYAIDLQGRLCWHYNTENGLLNNTVMRLLCDKDNNVWAALDNGIALIHSGSPFSVLTSGRDDPQIGTVFDLLIDGKNIWAATNQGFYRYNSISGSISLVACTGGQNWHVTRFGKQVFLGNNIHTMSISNGAATPLPFTTSSTCMMRCNINGQEIILEASYDRLYVYKQRTDGQWIFSNAVAGFTTPVRQMEIDQSGAVWVANMTKGIFRLELTPDLSRIAHSKYFASLNDSVSSMNYVMKIRGHVVFSDNRQMYVYDDIQHRIIPYEQLNNISIASTDIHSCTPIDDNTFWLSGRTGYLLMCYENENFHVRQFVPMFFFGASGNENMERVIMSGDTAYFNMNNCVARYIMDGVMNAWQIPHLHVWSVTSTTSDDKSILQLPIKTVKASDALSERNIKVCFSFPNFNREMIRFHYKLSCGKIISDTESDIPAVEYKNLSYGTYLLEAIAVNAKGDTVARCEYNFKIPLPLWLSPWAVGVYLFALGLIFWYFSKLRTNHVVAQKRKVYEEEKTKQDMKMLEQEKLIAKQRQQILEAELVSKGKQLANLSLNVHAKEKMIEGLKESLKANKMKSASNARDMDALLRQIESVSGSMEFLDIYQKNFDLIHEHFFRNLRERYPSLTSNDLRLCAFLRLNMSTKDIANITNMDVRGVETSRYRLRRKLKLIGRQSIVEFLIDFK